ncbi:helix-turn-helix domain-containing protein [Chryseobacterium lathyri]|jgi:DNA-binding transcriptional regulator YiaG|uniref:helix-turn-helix domain-containing protein n=1 Tax=Chryseobacterium lathyri TaxID=395933 RepID=UPI001CC12D5D|nr:helix-turn-helix domain-containing protein [Chryseobacterium lathyri]
MKRTSLPNYKLIFTDIISKKHPEKKVKCQSILDKEDMSILDVIKLNEIIFEVNDKESLTNNQKYKAYDESAILHILEYQKKNKLNNIQLANYFKLSRNTVAKWRKNFQSDTDQ